MSSCQTVKPVLPAESAVEAATTASDEGFGPLRRTDPREMSFISW